MCVCVCVCVCECVSVCVCVYLPMCVHVGAHKPFSVSVKVNNQVKSTSAIEVHTCRHCTDKSFIMSNIVLSSCGDFTDFLC